MARLAVYSGAALLLMAAVATAGQSSANFTAGVLIGGGPGHARQRATTYTWGAAEISVIAAGFTGPRRAERSATLYWFTGIRDGDRFLIAVSVSSGAVVKVIPA